ncbi:MAG: hypothetical protein NVSMB19_06510 [Vulcanimicrobiaceae bacterium]
MCEPLRPRRSAAAVALAAALLAATPIVAAAESPGPSATLAPADCRIVDATEAARVLGFPVGAPDESAARGGICFFPSRAVSQDGSVTYALVTAERLPQRRAYFAAAARRCGSVAKGAPREAVCRAYVRLAGVTDLDAYFEARTDSAAAKPVARLGALAIAAPDALYVRRGATVVECVVRRGEALDVERSTALARLVLERMPQQ